MSALTGTRPAPRAAPTGERGAQTRGAQPVVVCQRVTKVFRDFWMRSRARAVDNLNLTIEPHEIFGLLGPNGSGKSTAIKMMLGLLRPSSGRIAVFGRPASDVAVKKRIGYLPEESYMYPFLNARETLDYYGKLFELDHRVRKKRIDELLDMVGLTAAQFRPVREYSKGMQRRIGIAQALINDPDLLILDEPTTGLDPIGTRQVKDLILQLGRRGKTVILSSHLLADVEDCVDRMVILYGGKIRREGTCESLLERHGKTTIETDALDEGTIAEIDRVIRQRTGGEREVLRVSHPRQRLEELFLAMVEEAKVEQAATSGATSGGRTASFLAAGDEGPSGEALIDSLVSAGDREPSVPEPVDAQEPEPEAEQRPEAVIESLVSGEREPERMSSEHGPEHAQADDKDAEPIDTAGVDESVIGSLLEPGGKPRETRDARDRAGDERAGDERVDDERADERAGGERGA